MNLDERKKNPGLTHAAWVITRNVLPGTLVVAAIGWLVTDIVMRLGAHLEAPWMRTPETMALLILVGGGLFMGLRSRVAKITRMAAAERHNHSKRGSLFHLADGGTRLHTRHRGKKIRSGTPSTAFCDGGIHRKSIHKK